MTVPTKTIYCRNGYIRMVDGSWINSKEITGFFIRENTIWIKVRKTSDEEKSLFPIVSELSEQECQKCLDRFFNLCELDEKPIEDFEMTIRLSNFLRARGCKNLGDIRNLIINNSDMFKGECRGIGIKTSHELLEFLSNPSAKYFDTERCTLKDMHSSENFGNL